MSDALLWTRYHRAYVAGALGSTNPVVVSEADMTDAARLARSVLLANER